MGQILSVHLIDGCFTQNAYGIWQDIAHTGAADMLQQTYGDLLVEPTDGSDIMLRMDLASIPQTHYGALDNILLILIV